MKLVSLYGCRYIVICSFLLHDLRLDGMQNLFDSLIFPSGVDFLKNVASLLGLPIFHQPPRTLGQHKHQYELQDRGCSSQAHHPPPTTSLHGQSVPYDIGNDLPTSDEQYAQSDQFPPESSRRELRDIQRDHQACSTNRKTDDAPPHHHTRHRGDDSLAQSPNDEEDICNQDDRLPTNPVSQ